MSDRRFHTNSGMYSVGHHAEGMASYLNGFYSLKLFSSSLCLYTSVALSFYFSDPGSFLPLASLVSRITAKFTGMILILLRS